MTGFSPVRSLTLSFLFRPQLRTTLTSSEKVEVRATLDNPAFKFVVSGMHGMNVDHDDLQRLRPERWLGRTVIQAFARLLRERCERWEQDGRPVLEGIRRLKRVETVETQLFSDMWARACRGGKVDAVRVEQAFRVVEERHLDVRLLLSSMLADRLTLFL